MYTFNKKLDSYLGSQETHLYKREVGFILPNISSTSTSNLLPSSSFPCKHMMCSSSMEGKKICDLPPGFRFHPTDEELIMYYLKNHATLRSYPVSSIVTEVDIYKFDPWELPEKAEVGENEWYFFTPRNRKYPNGMRPNRATTSGYWKATGTDKAIHSGSSFVGVRKTLVFYEGRPPRGVKTVWIMNEYRLADSSRLPTKLNGSMRMDDWVLCRIYRKGHSGSSDDDRTKASSNENTETIGNQEAVTLPPLSSLGHVLETEYLSVSHLWNDNTFSSASNIQSINSALFDNFEMDKFQVMFT